MKVESVYSKDKDEISVTEFLEREFGMQCVNTFVLLLEDQFRYFKEDIEPLKTHVGLPGVQIVDPEEELIKLFTTKSIEQLKQGITHDESTKMISYFEQQLNEYKYFMLLFKASNKMIDFDDKIEEECETLRKAIRQSDFKKVIESKLILHIDKCDETMNYERCNTLIKDLENEINHFRFLIRQDVLRNIIKIIFSIDNIICGNQNVTPKEKLDEKVLKKQMYIIEEKYSRLIWEKLLLNVSLNELTFEECSKWALMLLLQGKLERIVTCEIFEKTEDDTKEAEKVQKLIEKVKKDMQPYRELSEGSFIKSFSKERKKFVRGDLYELFYELVQQNNWKLIDKLSEISGIILIEGIYNGILHFMEYIVCSKPTKNSALTEQEYEKKMYALYIFSTAFAKIQIKCSGVSKSQIAELAYCCLYAISIITEKISKSEREENAWEMILLFGQIVDEFSWKEAQKIVKTDPVRRNNGGLYQNDLFEKLLHAEMNDTYIHSDAKTKEAQLYCYICKSVMYILNRKN